MRSSLKLLLIFSSITMCSPALPAQKIVTRPAAAEPNSPSDTVSVRRPYPVIGKPFSATIETEKPQTSADGTHVDHKRSTKSYRDSEGRSRTEHASLFIPGAGDSTDIISVLIHDPVAGADYLLNPRDHTARALMTHAVNGTNTAELTPRRQIVPASGAPGNSADSQAKPERLRSKISTEDLGTQVMEGLVVEGKRTTMTLPVGAQGNDRPIEVVTDRWYSTDLGAYILIKATDPRSGNTTIQMTNIDRSEPDPSLFQVPPDYSITQQ